MVIGTNLFLLMFLFFYFFPIVPLCYLPFIVLVLSSILQVTLLYAFVLFIHVELLHHHHDFYRIVPVYYYFRSLLLESAMHLKLLIYLYGLISLRYTIYAR